jgi:hypothetical protein
MENIEKIGFPLMIAAAVGTLWWLTRGSSAPAGIASAPASPPQPGNYYPFGNVQPYRPFAAFTIPARVTPPSDPGDQKLVTPYNPTPPNGLDLSSMFLAAPNPGASIIPYSTVPASSADCGGAC